MNRRYFKSPGAPLFTHYPVFSSQAVPTNKDDTIEIKFSAAFATRPGFDMPVRPSGQPVRSFSTDPPDDAAVPFALF
jgi:hypothetical protein